MGRAKLNMELIKKEKSRNITFKKRKDGLMRKMHEFTTLCDVDACIIVYGPKQHQGNFVEPEIFPRDPKEVKRIINLFKTKSKEYAGGNFTVGDFYLDKAHQFKEEAAKVHKQMLEAKYPMPLDGLNTVEDCLKVHAMLTKKAEHVRELIRMKSWKNTQQGGGFDFMNIKNSGMEFAHAGLGHNFYGLPGFIQQMGGVTNHLPSFQFPDIAHSHNQEMYPSVMNHQNSMLRLLLTGNERYYGSEPSNGPYQQQASFLDSATGLAPSVTYHNERTTMAHPYYAQTMPYRQTQPSQQIQHVSNHHVPTTGPVCEEEFLQYLIKNNVTRFRHD